MCKKYYVHPALLQAYMEGLTMAPSVPDASKPNPDMQALPVDAPSPSAASAVSVPAGSEVVPERAQRKRAKAALRRDEVAVLQFLEELNENLPGEPADSTSS